MKFEHDIFISYAIIDNQPLMEGSAGWISELHRALEVRLSQLLGYKPKIWRDEKLGGNSMLTDILKDKVEKTALFLSVLSPRYILSTWTAKEVEDFHTHAQNSHGIRVGNHSRIFKVIKTPIELKDHPAQMQDMLGYEFFKVDQASGRATEFSREFGRESEQLFWAKLNDLAHDIADTLTALKQQAPEAMSEIAQGMIPVGAGPDMNGSGVDRRVFLAEATYDLREKRDVIRRELSDWGFRVFPEKNFPLVSPEIEKGTRESLSECKLSVHLIGANYGVIPEAGLSSLIELQNSVASDFSKESGLERIIWIPPGIQPADERQRGFLEKIQTDQETQFGAEIYQMPLETFKSALQEKLKNLEKKEEPAVAVNGTAEEHTPMVYVICDQDDIDAVADLEDFLFDQGFDVMLPIFEGEESQVRLDHQENLKEADAVIVYYGQSNDLWIRAKLRDFKKIPGYGRKKPLLHKYVYVSNSAGGRAARVRAQGVTVVQEEERFEGKVFDPMIRQLKTPQQDA